MDDPDNSLLLGKVGWGYCRWVQAGITPHPELQLIICLPYFLAKVMRKICRGERKKGKRLGSGIPAASGCQQLTTPSVLVCRRSSSLVLETVAWWTAARPWCVPSFAARSPVTVDRSDWDLGTFVGGEASIFDRWLISLRPLVTKSCDFGVCSTRTRFKSKDKFEKGGQICQRHCHLLNCHPIPKYNNHNTSPGWVVSLFHN